MSTKKDPDYENFCLWYSRWRVLEACRGGSIPWTPSTGSYYLAAAELTARMDHAHLYSSVDPRTVVDRQEFNQTQFDRAWWRYAITVYKGRT